MARRYLRWMLLLSIAPVVASLGAFAQTQGTTAVSGFFGGTFSATESVQVSFTCTGAPTCTGQDSIVERAVGCSNALVESHPFTMTGLNLAQSGPIQGTMTVGPDSTITRNANGTCTLVFQATNSPVPYTGTWNAATRTATITVVGDRTYTGGFSAEIGAPAPIFPMTVNSNIGPVTSSATANIQFRAQDVGQQGRVFTFASAPATRVQGGSLEKALQLGHARVEEKADPVACVLAQVNASGQLVAVSAAQLQAFSTGVLSAAGQSVSILNNTPTPNVTGATFYVGYGSSGQAMLDGGIFRNAVLVPGNTVCPPLPYMTSLWWNPSESGWGLNLNQQGSLMFGTLFTYDSSRAPMWLVMSAGALQSDGVSFVGDLYRTTGPAFNANPFTPIGAGNVTRVGTLAVTFNHANSATLTYSVNGTAVTKNIQRQVYGTRSANCLPTAEARTAATNFQDLWWNSAESGWGLNLTHQDNTFFGTLFTYDASGRDLWLVMSAGTRQADGSYLGDLYRTTGSAFNANPFPPIGASDVTNVGNMRLRFANGNSGTLTYTFNGTTVTKQITRQEFSSPVSACN